MEIVTIIATIALVIAIVGWVVSHYFQIRANNKIFLNQIANGARLETTKAIRDYQSWLVKVSIEIRNLSASYFFLYEHAPPTIPLERISSLSELFFAEKTPLEWIFCLEEYEILFPKTAKCRKELLDRHGQIQKYLSSFLDELRSASMKSTSALDGVIKKAQKDVGNMFDQIGLMQDLRIYLQNLCLSPLTGNKVPERPPPEPHVPRLVQDKEGNLHVFTPQKTNKNVGG